jgi:hypothetical protein
MIGEYQTRGIKDSGIFAYEPRNTEYQPPGSYQAIVEGDGVDLATPFSLNLGVLKESIPNAMYGLTELRLKLQVATSLKIPETNQWRALIGNQRNVKFFDPVPEDATQCGLRLWFVNVLIRPKFGAWTHQQAETLQGYLQYRDEYPFEAGQVPFSDWTYFSDNVGFES